MTGAHSTLKIQRYKGLQQAIPESTLVWQLTGKGFENFRLEEIPVPRMGPRDILFRSDSNGICFSDVKVVLAGPEHPRLKGYDMERDKVVPGHEISITVVKAGEEAKDRFRPGSRFIVQADMIEHDTAVGYGIWGGMIQYGVFDERVQEYLIPVEADIGYSQASLVEPWACIEASYDRADIYPTDRIVWVVGGGGPMGQMHILRTISRKRRGHLGALRSLLVTDVSDERLAAVRRRFETPAREAGLELLCINPLAGDFDAEMKKLAPSGVDYIVACAQLADVVNDARRHLARYGVLNLFAGLKRGTGPLHLGDIHYDQHTITGNSGSRLQDMEKVLRLAESGELDTDASAGAVVGMRACAEGVKAVAEGRITNKTILYPQLPDLPLTRIEDLPDIVRFSAAVERDLRSGVWSQKAETELLDALLEI
ncbi:MAG: zinc-binding dehydrogenase [Planctomycetes bacterium]|nr:zinc-binding dehydrogenase [Planctomycetota bacterium]